MNIGKIDKKKTLQNSDDEFSYISTNMWEESIILLFPFVGSANNNVYLEDIIRWTVTQEIVLRGFLNLCGINNQHACTDLPNMLLITYRATRKIPICSLQYFVCKS